MAVLSPFLSGKIPQRELATSYRLPWVIGLGPKSWTANGF